MKKQNMLRFFTSIIFIFLFFNKNNSQIVKDSLEIKNKYGIRVGIDISKQIRMLTEEYNGLSLYGDIKIKERLFIVSELGRETKKIINNNLNSEFSGNYIKAGINYNLYNNLPGLNNEIYIGFRVAVSKFESEISQYNIYNKDQFWIPESINDNLIYENLNANWIELIIGINSELVNNFFMGISLRLNRMLNQKKPENFTNLYIPGFNKVTENNNFGTGITYTLIYQIPIVKK
ncbi:MAG: hypothetical protein ISQ41_04260 [Flavobacteriaceae bacterium]|nr:hypothetical protein [Flavobacteriaceae bacterium]|tara:strand:- start:213 stop:911 length:699 start_codon:yes stop_codon:yes gene_type:complete